MTNDPMKDIEDRKGQFDMGVMAVRTFQGALSEAENWWEAFMATCAFFAGMFKGSQDPPEEKEKEKDD